MLATMLRMFMAVARKVIWAMFTAAASAAVGHLNQVLRHYYLITMNWMANIIVKYNLTFPPPPMLRYIIAPGSAD